MNIGYKKNLRNQYGLSGVFFVLKRQANPGMGFFHMPGRSEKIEWEEERRKLIVRLGK